MRIDIFCESGQKYGLGHFYRCIKLINLCLKYPQITSITLHNRGDFTPPPLHSLLPSAPHISLKCKSYEWLAHTQKEFDLVIIDSYEAQQSFYTHMQTQSKTVICFDDTFRDIYPHTSIILNPAPNAKDHFNEDYQNLWCGTEYMLLPQTPEEVIPEPDQAPLTTPYTLHRIFISFGGVDSANLTQATLESIESYLKAHTEISIPNFHIVLGNGYVHTLHIPTNLESHSFIYHDLSPNAFLALARSCDFALASGGGSMLELLSLHIPSIIIQSAKNQHFHIAQYAAMGAILSADNAKDSVQSLFTLLEKGPIYQNIVQTLSTLQFGTLLPQALTTLIESLQPHSHTHPKAQAKNLQAIDFRSLSEEQSQLVWTIRNHENTAKWMYSQYISPQMHQEFLNRIINDQTRKHWLIQKEGETLGVGSLIRINPIHRHAFVGIYKNPLSPAPSKGMNILNFLEYFAFEELQLHTIHLEVLEHNIQALRFYDKMGYKQEGRLTQFIYRDGRYYDVILMYKTKDM